MWENSEWKLGSCLGLLPLFPQKCQWYGCPFMQLLMRSCLSLAHLLLLNTVSIPVPKKKWLEVLLYLVAQRHHTHTSVTLQCRMFSGLSTSALFTLYSLHVWIKISVLYWRIGDHVPFFPAVLTLDFQQAPLMPVWDGAVEGMYHKQRHLGKILVVSYFKILLCYVTFLLFSSFMPLTL